MQASQATSYVNYVFWNDNQGFLKLYGAFKDALTVKTGFLKWWCGHAQGIPAQDVHLHHRATDPANSELKTRLRNW